MKFEKKIDEFLKENILGSLARGAITAGAAVGSGLNAAKSPGQGALQALRYLAGTSEEQKKKASQPFSKDNPPPKNGIAYTYTNIYSLDKSGKPFVASPSTMIFGKIITEMKDGKYTIQLIDDNDLKKPVPAKDIVIAKVPKAPYWQVYTIDAFKTPINGASFLPKRMLITGPLVNGVSPELKNWRLYVAKDFK